MCAGYRYIALVGGAAKRFRQITETTEFVSGDATLESRFSSGKLSIFSTRQTPMIAMPHGALVIGHLFFLDGSRVDGYARIPALTSPEEVRNFVLRQCWGEYLLVQPSMDEEEFSLTRSPSPSGDPPCFYCFRGDFGFVTSDVTIAEQLGIYQRCVNWDAVSQRLVYPDLKIGATTLANISELLPGCRLRVRGPKVSTALEWSPWDFTTPKQRHVNPQAAALELRHAVETTVRSLADTDKSILLELSGGLDSSIIGACLKRTSASVSCCSLVTPVPGAEERQYARLIARILGAELESVELGIKHALFEFPPPPRFVSPRIGPLQFAIDQVMEAAGDRNDATSYFSGAGGDTVFSYLRTAAPAADAFLSLGFSAGISAISDLSNLHQCTHWKAGRLALRKMLRPSIHDKPDRSFLEPGLQTPPVLHPWFPPPTGTLPGDRERIIDLVTTQSYRESQARGLERWLRMPLLAQPVVEAALKIPSWMWIAGGQNRAIARLAFADVLPQDILNRRSKGTFMSYVGAAYRENKSVVRELLLNGRLRERNLVDARALNDFLERDQAPRDRSFRRVLDLCMVENWLRHQP